MHNGEIRFGLGNAYWITLANFRYELSHPYPPLQRVAQACWGRVVCLALVHSTMCCLCQLRTIFPSLSTFTACCTGLLGPSCPTSVRLGPIALMACYSSLLDTNRFALFAFKWCCPGLLGTSYPASVLRDAQACWTWLIPAMCSPWSNLYVICCTVKIHEGDFKFFMLIHNLWFNNYFTKQIGASVLVC